MPRAQTTNLSRVEKAGRLVGYLTVVRDIGDRRRGARATRAMAQVGRELVASLDVGAAAERIVSTVVEVFQGRRAVLYEIDDASMVCVAAGGPEDCRSWMGWRLPSGAGIAWRALAEDRIVTSAETPESALPLDADPRLVQEEAESTVALPLRARAAPRRPRAGRRRASRVRRGRDRAPDRVWRPGGADSPECPPLRQE